jgi:hypothetical protein
MIEKLKSGLSLCFGLLLLSACVTETVDSKNINTQAMTVIARVNAPTDAASTVIATFKVGGASSNTYVDFSGGDRVFAEAGDKRVEMDAQDTGVYSVDFNTAAKDTKFVIDVQRENDDDAPATLGMLPEPFSFQVPNMSTSRADNITITWSPSGSNDNVTIDLSGSCIFSRTIDVPGDTGSHMISGGTLVSNNTEKPETCDVNVEMKRSRTGTVDPIFDNESTFTLTQTRTGKFTSAP